MASGLTPSEHDMGAIEASRPANMDHMVAAQQQVVKDILPTELREGVLVPLKTTLELRDDHSCINVIITRTPVKSANAVIT